MQAPGRGSITPLQARNHEKEAAVADKKFTPVQYAKGTDLRLATSAAEAVKLEYEGYLVHEEPKATPADKSAGETKTKS